MRILFLSHYFPPEVNAPATRTYEHCKRWVEQGHDVTVVSCVPHHPMGKAYPGYSNKWWFEENKDGIRAIKIKTYITANEGFIKRTLNYVIYMLMALIVSPFLPKADVVISTSPQFFNGLAGYLVSKIKRAPWLLEIRDLWPESILAVGAIKNKYLIGILEWLEGFAYRKADHIVPVTKAFKTHIAARGAAEDAITIIRNGVNLDLFEQTEFDSKLATDWSLENKFVAAYVGTHGMAHGLDVVLGAAKILREHEDIVFLLVGDGAERERLAAELAASGLNNVIMKGQQPKEMMPAIWSITDVSLVLLKKLDLFKTVIPSKIFESMAMSTPIILGVEGEVKGIIEEAASGLCIEPESAEELAAAVLRLKTDQAVYQQLSAAGRGYVAEKFDRKKLADQYLALLESMVS
jgi:glycosyltransferase involved in cell wall biosynthesis